jgi:polyhydroxybutyrate depolymerase
VRAALILLASLMCGASNVRGDTGPRHSPGCGIATSGTNGFETRALKVLDHDRTYHLRVPKTYESKRPYPIIFRWHGRSGDGLSGGLDIEAFAGEDAIVVAGDAWHGTWNSGDLVFFDRMLEEVEARFCVDRGRVFSYGFSAGGFFTNLLACERGDVLRASASVAGGPRGDHCRGKVARWFLHDVGDELIPIALGEAARDQALQINGCSTKTIDEGGGCVRYLGCDKAPVVWCQAQGFGHNIRSDFAPQRVWNFFRSLQ